MKDLFTYILETIEDGKYVDVPKTNLYMYKHAYSYSPRSAEEKERKRAYEAAWKEHVNLCAKVDEENFQILLSKICALMEDSERRADFVRNWTSAAMENIKNYPKQKEGETWTEEKLQAVLQALKWALQEDNSFNIKNRRWSLRDAPFEVGVYEAVQALANLYQIDVPIFSQDNDLDKKKIININALTENEPSYSKNYEKARSRAKAKYEKSEAVAAKARAKYRKTEQFKLISRIVDQFEDDIEALEKALGKEYERYDAVSEKNAKINKIRQERAVVAQDAIEAAFGDTAFCASCYGTSLVDILVELALKGDTKPIIEVTDKATSSWMSGLRKSLKFKVTASDGTVYTSGKYQDNGLDSWGRVDGFGPMD